MTEAGRRRRLVARAAIALLALAAATGARAGCSSVAGNHVFALGSPCTASGTYTPTVAIPGTPPQPIVGLFANGGGSIGADSNATLIKVDAKAAGKSYAVWSEGAGSAINFFTPSDVAVPVTISTSNGGTYAFYASSGGTIGSSTMTPEVASVTTTASGAQAVYAFGAGSTITLSLLPPTSPALATIVTTGLDSPGALSLIGGSISLTSVSSLTHKGRLPWACRLH
jgi:hypothetical protein